jgi:two-component system NtrC family sensor kinase
VVIPGAVTRDGSEAGELLNRLAPRGPYRGVMELRRRDGSTVTAEITGTPVLDDAGRLVALTEISSNVLREGPNVELERAHRTTAEALTLLATLQAEAPVGFGFVDSDLRFAQLNRKLASIIGGSIEDLLGQRAAEVVPPALWEQLGPVYRRVLATGEAVLNQPLREGPGTGGQGRQRLASHYPVRIGEEIIGIGVVVDDVTERVRAEGFRSAVMSQVVDGVYTQDRDGRLVYMNSAASRMLGWTETELRGKCMDDVVHFQKGLTVAWSTAPERRSPARTVQPSRWCSRPSRCGPVPRSKASPWCSVTSACPVRRPT